MLTRTRRLFSLAILLVSVCAVYGAVGVWTAGGEAHTLSSPVDAWIPLQPAWVLVYLAIFFQAVAPASVITHPHTLNRAMAGYVSLYLAGMPFWVFYPVRVVRTPVPVTDLWTYGIALCRYLDPPTNCMPSMHVAVSIYAALVVRRHDRAAGSALLAFAALITWSTLATEQHWFADVVVACFLALVCDAAWFGWRPMPADALRPLPRKWHATWFLAYVAVVLVLMSGWWFGWVPIERLPPYTERW